MPVIINGSTGISGTDGSASTPAVQGTDTNTGLFFPAADQIAFAEGGVEAMRLDASGRVGIGTSSPGRRLEVVDASRAASGEVGSLGVGATSAQQIRVGYDTAGYGWVQAGSFGAALTNLALNPVGGNVGIGTSSPAYRLQVNSPSSALFAALLSSAQTGTTVRSNPVFRIQSEASGRDVYMQFSDNITNSTEIGMLSGNMYFCTAATERARITSGGDFQFNSGYGSVATAFACRAWVNFNGTGTVAIRASGNVSSITDNGNGDYTANFTNAMPDANYAAFHFAGDTIASNANGRMSYGQAKTTTGYRFIGLRDFSGNVLDTPENSVAVFR